jgi:hypothetical protein
LRILPDEKIDFVSFQSGVTAEFITLQDQCQRLMDSLEESRRTNEAITAERDHYKEFWTVMNNYHMMMSHFQVSASSVGFTGAPLFSQMVCSSSPFIPQLGAAPLSLIPQTGVPPFITSAYPLYSIIAANLAAMDLKFQSHYQVTGEIVAPPPSAPHDDMIRNPDLFIPKPTESAKIQSPETPSKRTSMKSIESYFASIRKSVFSLFIEDVILIIPKPSPPYETDV